jgi:TusA-related sulfurtransferase
MNEMDFGEALKSLKKGKMIKRFSDSKVYMLKEDSFGSCKEEDRHTLIASVDEDGKTLAYYSFNY